jgi:hypothetical protein
MIEVIPKYATLEPILKPFRRRISPSSWVSDRMALHHAIALCKGCGRKVDPTRFEYRELTMFHADGMCDQCQVDGPCGLWLWEGSRTWQEYDESHFARSRFAGRR